MYKGSFSLTYGTVTLLRETKLHLKKFRSYGLLGPTNGGEAYEEEFIDDDEEPADSYKGSFSLAYGTVTLSARPNYAGADVHPRLEHLAGGPQIFIPGGQAAEPLQVLA